MNRNTMKKKTIQFTILSPFLSLFFFSLYFSFIPFLLHALTNSFLFFFFFVLPFFHYRGKQFLFSFFLSLSPFSFSLFSFLSFSLSAFSYFKPTFDDFISLVISSGGGGFLFFSLFPLFVMTNHFLVHLIFQHWGRAFPVVSLSLFLSLNNYERIFCYYIFVGR